MAALALFLAADDTRLVACEIVGCDAGNPVGG
jgi:hypothetical protein